MSRGTYSTTGFAIPAQSFPRCRLVALDGPIQGQTFELHGPETVVGGGTDCHLLIEHTTVSRRHCVIMLGPTSYMIRDLDSTNGTYVNGVRIKEAYLHAGVVIHAGQISFRLDPIG